MSEDLHSGSVTMPGYDFQVLVDLAPEKALALLGEARPKGDGYLVEAIRLSEFLEEFHDDEQLIGLSADSYDVAVKALTDRGYPARRSDWQIDD